MNFDPNPVAAAILNFHFARRIDVGPAKRLGETTIARQIKIVSHTECSGSSAVELNVFDECPLSLSVVDIVEAINALPSRHADLTAVLVALLERMDAESGYIASYGFDVVAGHLEDACGALQQSLTAPTLCTLADKNELARIEHQHHRAHAGDIP